MLYQIKKREPSESEHFTTESSIVVMFNGVQPLRKHAYSNILKISPPKTESFQIKILIFFSFFCSKHRLWVLVRTASARFF